MTPTPDTEERRPRTKAGAILATLEPHRRLMVLDIEDEAAAAPQPAEPGMRGEARLDIPADVEEWIDEAIIAMNREGSVDWDNERRVAEAVAVRLWNYLSEGLIPAPAALARDAEPAGLDVETLAFALHDEFWDDSVPHEVNEDCCITSADHIATRYAARLRESAKPEGGA